MKNHSYNSDLQITCVVAFCLLTLGCDITGPNDGHNSQVERDFTGWRYLNPQPTGENLFDVNFFDERLGWIVGGAGTILHTKDWGVTWTQQNSRTSLDIGKVQFVSRSHGWVLSKGYGRDWPNTLFRTDNGGITWNEVSTGFNFIISEMIYLDERTGLLAGSNGVILKTTDAGVSWKIVNQSDKYSINSIDFSNSSNGIATAYEWESVEMNGYLIAIYKPWTLVTSDGGRTWEAKSHDFFHTEFTSVNFVSDDRIWTVANEHHPFLDFYKTFVLESTDGGLTWKRLEGQSPPGLGSGSDVEFVFDDECEGWALTSGNSLQHTIDCGETWTSKVIDDISIQGFDVVNENTIWVVGWRSRIYKSNDRGATWISLFRDVPTPRSNLKFFDEKTGIGRSGDWVMTTVDGGANGPDARLNILNSH